MLMEGGKTEEEAKNNNGGRTVPEPGSPYGGPRMGSHSSMSPRYSRVLVHCCLLNLGSLL